MITSEQGLSHVEAQKRLKIYGKNEISRKKTEGVIIGLLKKLANPLVLLLFVVGSLSWIFSDWFSAIVIYLMAILSAVVSFIQEHRAEKAAEHLASLVRSFTTVIRDGKEKEVPFRDLVPGDLIIFSAGEVVPADTRIVESNELMVDQSSLTGESYPVVKSAESISGDNHDITKLTNMAFVGSHVTSGTGKGIVVQTGKETYFGKIYAKLAQTERKTEFDKEMKDFTWLLIRMILVMAVVLFLINIFKHHSFIGSTLFALTAAIAVSPEILPMVVMFNLSKGALEMSKKKVVVKRLDAIQNFGGMDILCADKTGTLTLNSVVLETHCNLSGVDDEQVLKYGYINSFFQTGLKNVLDQAILKHEKLELHKLKKIGEIPFDFERKIMSVAVEMDGKKLLIAKGAPEEIIKRCQTAHLELTGSDGIPKTCASLNTEGFRVLAVAIKEIKDDKKSYSPKDEVDMTLVGYLAFLDPLKPTVKISIEALEKAGIKLKVITGDSELVAKKICAEVGLDTKNILTGVELEDMSDDALRARVEQVSVFARIAPLQKERIIQALRNNKHIVGYLGDGINDSPALKTADIGISVNNAVDVAKESASIILLQKDLRVLLAGVLEGRRVFGNFMKYIHTSTSYYVGFIITSTVMSLVLPFLPLLPLQILLNNYLYDLMQAAMPADNVDNEYLQKPKIWRISQITKYVLLLGPIYSLFDFLMIGILIVFFQAFKLPEIFRH